jgi:hypothetical protein
MTTETLTVAEARTRRDLNRAPYLIQNSAIPRSMWPRWCSAPELVSYRRRTGLRDEDTGGSERPRVRPDPALELLEIYETALSQVSMGTCCLAAGIAASAGPDPDAAVRRAVEFGTELERPIANQPYGRTGVSIDPFGHRWMIQAQCSRPGPATLSTLTHTVADTGGSGPSTVACCLDVGRIAGCVDDQCVHFQLLQP